MDKARYVITLDTDWAPQFMIDYVVDLLQEFKIPATIFCTTPYFFKKNPQIEIGLHPNLMNDSTQGDCEENRLSHVALLYPKAVGCRTHRLYWHSNLEQLFLKHGIKYDSSVLIPFQSDIEPIRFMKLVRFPIWCGDNLYMRINPDTAVFNPSGFNDPGLKVLNFHPVHIWFNSRTIDETLSALNGHILPQLTEQETHSMRRRGNGMEKIFIDVLSQLSKKERVSTLKEML
ncbi:hypothetical protein [Maridesulfovibrio sp.]|uniref:polysaccharide deacetylase WbmS family protein n=1 Tax=Maridesulfovibrio sp. TaxID=2795000 RepID=UPI0029CA0B9D|nr:hypothetical protein [Maridesulfovibrio sp.]